MSPGARARRGGAARAPAADGRPLDAATVRRLVELRHRYDPGDTARKRALLESCASRPLTDPRVLRAYHDVLLFMEACPDDAPLRWAVEAEARRVEAAAGRGPRSFLNSGLPGTLVEAPFSLETSAWLLDRRLDADVAWSDGSAGDPLDEFLSLCVEPVERDGLLDASRSTEAWLRLARGGLAQAHLGWLLPRLRALSASPELLDRVYESLELCVRFRLPDAAGLRFPPRRPFYFRGGLRRDVALPRILGRRLPAPRRLTGRAAGRMIDVARAVLCAKRRETDPVTYANPAEVTLVSLERGVDLALFGMLPQRRLPLEGYFGYIAARNRVPVAYGGGWVFFERGEIGINVFEAHRGGESAHLFAQILRVYHQHYGVRRFVVDPFQFGRGNRDGIRSGAFWFYYRLGFRPLDRRLAELAAGEWQRIRAARGRRTPAATLRRLTGGKLALNVGATAEGAPNSVALGLAVTRELGERFGGDGARARRWAERSVARRLGVRGRRGWPAEQRRAFDGLCPVVALIPDLGAWPVADKRALVALMRAKGGPRERAYALALQAHPRLRDALHALASATGTS